MLKQNTQAWGPGGGPDSSPQFWIINVASTQGPRGLFKNTAQLGWTHFFCSVLTAGKPADQGSRTKLVSYKHSALNLLYVCRIYSFFLLKKNWILLQFCFWETSIALSAKTHRTLWSVSLPHWGHWHKDNLIEWIKTKLVQIWKCWLFYFFASLRILRSAEQRLVHAGVFERLICSWIIQHRPFGSWIWNRWNHRLTL